MSPASFSTAASGTPVHSLALRIIPSWVREGLGPSPLKYSKNVASLPEHSMTVRTLRPGKRRNWSKLRVSGVLTSPKICSSQASASPPPAARRKLDGVVQVGGRDEPLQVHYRRPDPDRAALIVRQRDRFDVFGRPAVPVAGFLGVGRVRADRLVHAQKIGDRALPVSPVPWPFLMSCYVDFVMSCLHPRLNARAGHSGLGDTDGGPGAFDNRYGNNALLRLVAVFHVAPLAPRDSIGMASGDAVRFRRRCGHSMAGSAFSAARISGLSRSSV